MISFSHFESDLKRLLKEDTRKNARFTSMIDFYALPDDFPGYESARHKTSSIDKVAVIESALRTHFGDRRFIPYIQLYEFEALLYCDLGQLETRIMDSSRGITNLVTETTGLQPEEINDGPNTAPSKRLIRHVPIYKKNKVRVGATAAAAIGLHQLRNKCPHFNDWIQSLESMGAESGFSSSLKI